MAGASNPSEEFREIISQAILDQTKRYSAALEGLYRDPQKARAEVATLVRSEGARAAGELLATAPATFGDLKPMPVARIQAEAAYVGGAATFAYQLLAARDNPLAAARLLDHHARLAFTFLYKDGPGAHAAWADHATRNSLDSALDRLRQRPQEFGEVRRTPDRFVESIATWCRMAARTREIAAAHEREHLERPEQRLATLPSTTEELRDRAGGRLPELLEMKLEAYAADFRGKLGEAYQNATTAEQAFHRLAAREGIPAAVALVQRDARLLGDLSPDPGAAEVARVAVTRGARAYELNGITNPAHAADVLRRETQRSLARQCSNPGNALLAIQDAMRKLGHEPVLEDIAAQPERYFQPKGAEPLNGPTLASELRAMTSAEATGQAYVEAAERRPPPELPTGSRLEAAVRDHARAEATFAHKEANHVAVNEASAKLRAIGTAEKWRDIHSRQFDAALGRAFVDGPAARKAFDALAREQGPAHALAQLQRRSRTIGKMPEIGSRLAFWKRSLDPGAASAAAAAVGYAHAMFERRSFLEKVEWKDASGASHHGATAVRSAAAKQLGDAAAEIAQAERSLRGTGGPHAAMGRVVTAMEALRNPQGSLDRLAAERPELAASAQKARDVLAGRQAAASFPGIGIAQAAGHARTMAEGPVPL